MVGFLLFLLLASEAFSFKVLDRCEIDYRRCAFDCVQEFPLDKEKRKGCETRCKFDKVLCEVREGVKGTIDNLKRFLEGFSRER